MANLVLNNVEIAILKGAARRGDPDEDYQELLHTLDSLCDSDSGAMFISKQTLEQIQEFGVNRRNPRWRATLSAIFKRTLGDELGQVRDESGKLQEQEEPGEPKSPPPGP